MSQAVSDDARQHPPSERKLARLRAAGSTPVSPALAGAAALLCGWLLLALGGEAAFDWFGAWVREAIEAAREPEMVPSLARTIALRGGLLMAVVSGLVLAGVLVAQGAQAGRRPEAAPTTPAQRRSVITRPDAWRGGRALLVGALALVVAAATVRAALLGAEGLLDVTRPLEAAVALARSVGWPLVVVLGAVAVLDALAERAVWMHGARMTRREVDEELRDTEGPPLTRQRRGVTSRRGTDA